MVKRRVLLIHGGAGNWDSKMLKRALNSLNQIGIQAYKVLEKEGAFKAALYALNLLEEDPTFNAGRGSNLNLFGEIEVDASIMEGRKKEAGAIAAVRNVKYASTLASKVIMETPHILLTGWTANFLARKHNLIVDENELIIKRRYEMWKKGIELLLAEIREWDIKLAEHNKIKEYLKSKRKKIFEFLKGNLEVLNKIKEKLFHEGNTVGVVAYDNGNIVAGTSTGGTFLKLPGRIGDTPLIGSGTYADNNYGGVSATGLGETIILSNLAFRLTMALSPDNDVKETVKRAFNTIKPKLEAGVIVIDHRGEWTIAHTTKNMPAVAIMEGEIYVNGVWDKI